MSRRRVNRSYLAVLLVFAAACAAAHADGQSPISAVVRRPPPRAILPVIHPVDSAGFVWGVVLDDSLGRGLAQANITKAGTSVGTYADSFGRFRLFLGPGSHVLRIRRIGYAARTESVTVSPRAGQYLTIRLRPAKLKLMDVCACDDG
jgi:hypothetical protein